MSAEHSELRWTWLLGRESYQRVCLRFWLVTSCVYGVLLVLHVYAAAVGLITESHARIIVVTAVLGLSAFYVALRSGWSKQRDDPALTAVQMGFAFLMLGVAYVLTPTLRGTLLVVNPLVLLFGAFTLTPRQCRQLGAVATVVQGLAMLMSVGLQVSREDSNLELINFLCCAVIFATAADMAARLSTIREQLRIQKRALNTALERVAALARQDDLTQLPNRRHAIEMMEYEGRRAQRDKVPPSICMLDIDHFKRINDTHGHAAGDDVLRMLARGAVSALRGPDILARWGGEEFILLMPETPAAEALQVVERLRQRLVHSELWLQRPELQVTFSAGIAVLAADESIQDTVARADAALYRAKQEGRNRTVLA
jgi:diguanylate cyclase (GGDEF)-like protein